MEDVIFCVVMVILFAVMWIPGIIIWRRKTAREEMMAILDRTEDGGMHYFESYKDSFYIIKRLGLRNAFICAFRFGYTIGKFGEPIVRKERENQAHIEKGGADHERYDCKKC